MHDGQGRAWHDSKSLELTWHGPTNRWKKYRQGKTYYFKFPNSREGYDAALAEWAGKLAERQQSEDEQKPYRAWYDGAVSRFRQMARWCTEAGQHELAATFTSNADALAQRFASMNPPPPLAPAEEPDLGLSMFRQEWPIRVETLSQTPEDRTVQSNVVSFLRRKEAQVLSGELSAGRYDGLRVHLERFQNWIGPAFPVHRITARTLVDYHSHLLKQIAEGKIGSKFYARDCMVSVRQFIRRCAELDLCQMPKTLTVRTCRSTSRPGRSRRSRQTKFGRCSSGLRSGPACTSCCA